MNTNLSLGITLPQRHTLGIFIMDIRMEATKTLLKVGEELEKEESGEVPLWGAGGNKCVSNGRRKGYV